MELIVVCGHLVLHAFQENKTATSKWTVKHFAYWESPPGYVFHHKPRPVGRGGGVGFLVSKQFKVNLQPSPNYTTFEPMGLNISNSCFSGNFICIYRPPGHPANFFEQFQDLLENVVTIHSDFYIVGDFNLHLDTPSATTTTFNDILASFDTTQHVNFPTHIHGHWLDIVITRSSCKNIQTPTVVDGLSDHNTVIAHLKVRTAPAVSKHNVFYRAFHSFNTAAFMADITTSNLVTHPENIYQNCTNSTIKYLKHCLTNMHPLKLNLCRKNRQLPGWPRKYQI